MTKRSSERQQLARKLEALSDSEVGEVLEYIAIMESTHRSNKVLSGWDDELIARLSEAHENRRARQAFEWEAVRRRAERRAVSDGPRA